MTKIGHDTLIAPTQLTPPVEKPASSPGESMKKTTVPLLKRCWGSNNKYVISHSAVARYWSVVSVHVKGPASPKSVTSSPAPDLDSPLVFVRVGVLFAADPAQVEDLVLAVGLVPVACFAPGFDRFRAWAQHQNVGPGWVGLDRVPGHQNFLRAACRRQRVPAVLNKKVGALDLPSFLLYTYYQEDKCL